MSDANTLVKNALNALGRKGWLYMQYTPQTPFYVFLPADSAYDVVVVAPASDGTWGATVYSTPQAFTSATNLFARYGVGELPVGTPVVEQWGHQLFVPNVTSLRGL